MKEYTMICSNGWIDKFEAKSLRAAKVKATKLATHGCGSFSITEPNGTIHSRKMWEGFTAWGWHKWSVCEQY